MLKKVISFVLIFASYFFISIYAFADDEDTFTSVAPDALIILDLSGSMEWSPSGSESYIWSNSTCSGTYYSSSGSGHTYKCTRMEIAKRAIFSILDYDGSGTINSSDSSSLNVRFGYMRFYNGTVKQIQVISSLGGTTGTKYSTIFCGNATSCSSPSVSGSCSTSNMTGTSSETIVGACATGGTPLATALTTAKTYLNTHKASDPAKSCRQKFVILITDGADTYACSGNGGECQEGMYERRRQVVAAAKQLNDSGYKVFVIGLGSSMPAYLTYTLNWMAYYGGTDAGTTKSGSTSSYSIANTCSDSSGTCCDLDSNSSYCFPSGVSSCTADSSVSSATCYSGGTGVSTAKFQANSNDPGYLELTGYAFLASNATELNSALATAVQSIQASAYTFSTASIQAIRTKDESYVYEASFYPYTGTGSDPFWKGYFKRYTISTDDGSVSSTADWDAGAILKSRTASGRAIYTLLSGTLTAFNSTNISAAKLGVSSASDQSAIITFIRGGEQSGGNSGWKLGDIFHSSPITIGTPNIYFYDKIDTSTTNAFATFRTNHTRTSALGNRLLLTGANDSQFHVFLAGESSASGGSELWSFIPPNFLTRLSSIAHSSHPSGLSHQYFIDGPVSAGDVWLGTGTGKSKTSSDWHTLAVLAEGRGGNATLWSASSTCTPTTDSNYGYSQYYSVTSDGTTTYYPYHCGYYAFDVTETLNTPAFMWHLGGTTALTTDQGPYFGQPWSKMTMGRVTIAGNEKWVGFVGGGYSGSKYSTTGTAAGKGFFVVDASSGNILWKFTYADDSNMVYDLAGPVAAIDYDNDGFIDTVYIGDTGGNVWRFKFCLGSNTSCTWSGARFFNGDSLVRPIYTAPAVTKDTNGNLWVYFGTGDITDPTSTSYKDYFFAVKDTDRSSIRSLSNLDNISSTTYSTSSSNAGWYFKLNGTGEKILADPTLYSGIVYFTTFVPSSDSYCSAGESYLYAVDYITGAAEYTSGTTTLSGGRAIDIGSGVASTVTVSVYGGKTYLYVSTSECSGGSCTKNVTAPTNAGSTSTNLLYWRDKRLNTAN